MSAHSSLFEAYWRTNSLAASILAGEHADLRQWWVVERYLHTLPVGERIQARSAIDTIRVVCLAGSPLGSGEIEALERDGLRLVPLYLSSFIAPHAPQLTGQAVPRLALDCGEVGDE